MATARTSTTKRTGSRTARKAAWAAAKPVDAIKLLKDDHWQVRSWFKKFEELEDDTEKEELAGKICEALTVHSQIEEEIFYPALREAIEDEDLLDEAEVEHAATKELIAEIGEMTPDDRLFEAKVKVLGEYMNHHIEEEESEIFPEARDSGVDLKALGEQLSERKAELMGKKSAH